MQIICNKKLRGETGERVRWRVSCADLLLRRIWIAFVFTTTQGCVVCQRLSLIMELVSARLCKWHARVHWRVLVDVAMRLCARQRAHGCRKKRGEKNGQLYFSRDCTVHVCVQTFPHNQIHWFLSAPVHQMNMAWGLGLAQACVHAFLSVKVVKWNRISQNVTAAVGFGLPLAKKSGICWSNQQQNCKESLFHSSWLCQNPACPPACLT